MRRKLDEHYKKYTGGGSIGEPKFKKGDWVGYKSDTDFTKSNRDKPPHQVVRSSWNNEYKRWQYALANVLGTEFENDLELRDAHKYEKGGSTHTYKLGDTYPSDFDTYGMLKTGTEAHVTWGIPKLEKLYKSYESMNFDTAAKPLWDAIQLMKSGNNSAANSKLVKFNWLSKEEIGDYGEGLYTEN